MTDNNLITPPPELIAQIRREALHKSEGQLDYELRLIHDAYRAGADQELEACCEWLVHYYNYPKAGNLLRAARRPKPKSLAEKALASLDGVALPEEAWQAVSAALERLRELEKGNE